jgi:DNA-binding response OmpR family regulator
VVLVTRPAPASVLDAPPLALLTAQEQAVYQVLASNAGRVVSRAEIARQAGIAELSERRCDSLIVGIRRRIGADQITTVRRRGWMLVGSAAG